MEKKGKSKSILTENQEKVESFCFKVLFYNFPSFINKAFTLNICFWFSVLIPRWTIASIVSSKQSSVKQKM